MSPSTGTAGSGASSTSPPAGFVVDTSVAIKWYVPEPGAAAAVALLQGGFRLYAPDRIASELGNVLWKKARRSELTPSEAAMVAEQFAVACPVTLRPTLALLRPAVEIAARFDRTVYDALYLATALSEGVPFVTADQRLHTALTLTPLAPFIRLLGSVP